ncbi:MAG: undecaprenyl-phosphate alpha-N-acetylglucosaminyl 1-phosphate transferase, partial [Gammaproteobacteria bacterium]|nr:undecaprenyl-phosphate alpha-N-acetylglucosaminyl 1-phosphate transferase [Gammaproteobacteria bacterium]
MPIAIAMATAFISIIALTRVAESLRLVDHPQGRKQHVESTPVIGGIAITLSLL